MVVHVSESWPLQAVVGRVRVRGGSVTRRDYEEDDGGQHRHGRRGQSKDHVREVVRIELNWFSCSSEGMNREMCRFCDGF